MRSSAGKEGGVVQARQLIYVLWPSFIVAGAAEALFFTVFDPYELTLFGEPLNASRTTIYSLGFFLFWAFAAASSSLTCFLQRSSAEVNRCPIPDPTQRPAGCPKRLDENASC
jgi:hypothetical protein